MKDPCHITDSGPQTPDDAPGYGSGFGSTGEVLRTYTAHVRMTYVARKAIEVEATSVEEAILKANQQAKDIEFDWDDVDQSDSDHEVFAIDDEAGAEVYSSDDDGEVDCQVCGERHAAPAHMDDFPEPGDIRETGK